MMKQIFTICTLFCAISLFAKTPSLKADHLVIKDIQEDAVTWMVDMKQAHYTMVIVGPEGVEKRHYNEGEDAIFEITNDMGELRADGLYKFEITFSPILSRDQKEIMQQLRDNPSDSEELRKMAKLPHRYESVSGNFRILNGAIIVPENMREMEMQQALMEAAKGEEGFNNGRDGEDKPGEGWDTNEGGTEDVGTHDYDDDSRAQTFATDLIVQGSECVGVDCTSGESFGFDTLRLKENNLRIKFQDTSNSGSFPSRDWQITANDSSNGGANKFSIDDIDGSRTPFTIEAGAPSHSLYVDDGGRIGIGKSTPVVEVHVVDGDSPTLRLEQDGSSGFQAQTWDLAGNETNFFVRDVSNGSKLPFKVFPNAPTNSLTIEGTTGDIGIGTHAPEAVVDVRDSSATTPMLQLKQTNGTLADRNMIHLSNKGGSRIDFENTDNSVTWRFATEDTDDDFIITKVGSGSLEFQLTPSGDLTVAGTVTGSSSRYVKENVVAVESEQLLNAVDQLPINYWNYIADEGDHRHIGPMAEDFWNTFGVGINNKSIAPADMAGIALASVKALKSKIEDKDSAIEDLKKQNEALLKRLEALEAAIQ